jgi:hypothetical protein
MAISRVDPRDDVVTVKWIKITEVPINIGGQDVHKKRVFFAGMASGDWLLYWFILDRSPGVPWAKTLVERMENGMNVTVTSVGTDDITFSWQDDYSAGGGPSHVENSILNPVHRMATNVV